MSNQKSFTIIELLTVIAIIGLLSSIILVNFNPSVQKQKAKIANSLEFSQSIQSVLGSEGIATWRFDEGSGNTAKDASGNGNNGVINGASYVSDTPQAVVGVGQERYSLKFDGNGYVIGPFQNFTAWSEATIEAWINPSSLTNAQIAGSYWGGYSPSIDLNSNGTVYIHFGMSFNELIARSASVLVPGKWYHIVGVAKTGSAGYAKIYVDGALEATAPGNSSFTENGSIIAGARGPGTYFFNGLIDEVRIYRQALQTGEIQKHYAEK